MKFHQRIQELGFSSYLDYLKSEHWSNFKQRYRNARLPMRCQVCSSKKVQLHHHTYERLGNEYLQDVTPLCRNHHEAVHKWLKDSGRISVEDTPEAIVYLRNVLLASNQPVKKGLIEGLLELPDEDGFCMGSGKLKYACKSWFCKICSARLRKVAGFQLSRRIMESKGFLFSFRSDPNHWETDVRRMRRKGVEWVRIGSAKEPGLVIGVSQDPYGTAISYSDAIAMLGEALRSIAPVFGCTPPRFRPVNASHGWSVSKDLNHKLIT